ncbi:MAG: hypothetical protein WA751_09975 [Candidatus Dormiibacterota bacterium]
MESSLGVVFGTQSGTALLVTDDCQMDKRTGRAQKPKITHLQFVPVRDLKSVRLEEDTVTRLRDGDLQPPGAIYLELTADLEGVAFLAESFPIPAQYFALESQDFSAEPGSDPADPFHVVPTQNDTRGLTMTAEERRLLQQKLAFYWSHAELPDEPPK